MNFVKLTSEIEPFGKIFINPWEISSVSPRETGGSNVLTKRGMNFRVNETTDKVEELANEIITPKNNLKLAAHAKLNN